VSLEIVGSFFEFACLFADILPLFSVYGLLLFSALLRLESEETSLLKFSAFGLNVSPLSTFCRSWLLGLLPGLSVIRFLCVGKGDGPSSHFLGANADLKPRLIVGKLTTECLKFMFTGCSNALRRNPFYPRPELEARLFFRCLRDSIIL